MDEYAIFPNSLHDFESGPFNHLGTPPFIENRSSDLQPAIHFFGKTVSILFALSGLFLKSAAPLQHKDLQFSITPL
ncbi:hypothetical protein HMPREF1545_00140 [Oscillibacter sp. KLE 1728]|jgi:hypothetical protein|nr:hypothetical protein HMPREF1545_00140 [Oscillibacter sp. KLE 1728]